jgi:hypothetical protein
MENKQKILEECIRQFIRDALNKKVNSKLQSVNERRMENEIRSIVRSKILEAKKSPIPQDNTGANILEETLRRIVPIIKDAFFALTSDIGQRRSFRAHIINGFRNSLSPYRTIQGYKADGVDAGPDDAEKELGLLPADPRGQPMNEIDIDINNDDARAKQQGDQIDDNDNGIPDAEENFIEVEPDKKKEAEASIDPQKEKDAEFGIPGEDSTGRNVALQAFKKIEKAITDDYSMLDNKKDREIFYEYGIINLKLYFDRWEEELQNNIKEK